MGGHREAEVHHDGIYGIRADDSSCGYLDCPNGSTTGLQPLAVAAPIDLRDRDFRSDPLLLAGEIRRSPTP